MTPSELVGTFVLGILIIAALSLVVAPSSNAAGVINALGKNFTDILGAAKSYP